MPKMMVILVSTVLIMNHFAMGQNFERSYPGLGLSDIGSVDNTLDSGFILCGSKDGAFLLKLNAGGDLEWSYNDTGVIKSAAAVIQDASGNFVVTGSGPSQQYTSVAVVSTFDQSGDPVNDNLIQPISGWGSWGTTITRSPDRTFSHYCFYTDGYTADNYYSLDNGDVIGGDMTTVGINSISMDDHGNYYAVANLAFDMDSLFNWRNNVLILSSNHFQRTELFYDTKILASAITTDGGVMVAGLYDTLGTQYLRLMKFDTTANLTYSFFITDTNVFTVQQITETADGGFALLCGSNDRGVQHISFIKVDALGNVAWKQHFFGNGTAYPKNFRILKDGFIVLGNSGGDPYLIRTDSLGRVGITEAAEIEKKTEVISVFPNPSNGIFSFSKSIQGDRSLSFMVTDMQGRVVYNAQVELPALQMDLSFLAKGVYQFKFTANHEELKCGKFVIE